MFSKSDWEYRFIASQRRDLCWRMAFMDGSIMLSEVTIYSRGIINFTQQTEREWDKFIRSENWVYDAAIRAKFERNENLFSELFFSSNFSDSAVAAASLLLLLLSWIASHCIRLWALVWLVHNAARSSSTGEKCEKCYNNSVCELEQVEEIQILQNAIFYNF